MSHWHGFSNEVFNVEEFSETIMKKTVRFSIKRDKTIEAMHFAHTSNSLIELKFS
jgi:hypothetical protein